MKTIIIVALILLTTAPMTQEIKRYDPIRTLNPLRQGLEGPFEMLYPQPRKDTVDWPRLFPPPDTTEVGVFNGIFKDQNFFDHFSYFVIGAVVGNKSNEGITIGRFKELVTIDGYGKLHVTDSLEAIQELIKNYLYLNDLYKNHKDTVYIYMSYSNEVIYANAK